MARHPKPRDFIDQKGDARRAVGAHKALMHPVDGLQANRGVLRLNQSCAAGPSQSGAGAVAAKRSAPVGVAEIHEKMPLSVDRHLDHAVGADAEATVADALDLA